MGCCALYAVLLKNKYIEKLKFIEKDFLEDQSDHSWQRSTLVCLSRLLWLYREELLSVVLWHISTFYIYEAWGGVCVCVFVDTWRLNCTMSSWLMLLLVMDTHASRQVRVCLLLLATRCTQSRLNPQLWQRDNFDIRGQSFLEDKIAKGNCVSLWGTEAHCCHKRKNRTQYHVIMWKLSRFWRDNFHATAWNDHVISSIYFKFHVFMCYFSG